MDQLKEILRQAIKYRFWIAVGISALLPLIAYFVGVGPVQAKAKTETDNITSSDKDVKQYTSGIPYNPPYKAAVVEKTEDLTKDVDATWRKLYGRQAPLLTWPERVRERFTTWGRKWPEKVDASAVQVAIIDYANAYPQFVTEVYKSFKPFDPITGEGVVSAPPEAALLRPAAFAIDTETPPTLGKVWASQERLWIQRTLLDVVAQVNKKAKDWDSAVIKQINALEVGSYGAQDQRSIAKGDTLEPAPDVVDPSKPVVAAEDAGTSTTSSYPGMAPGMMGGKGMGGAAAGNSEELYYIKNDSTQFKIMPVEISVLIEQNHINDFLVALENSPMTIQVRDFEMSKPSVAVIKPEKGQGGNFGMFGDAMSAYGSARGMSGYPGMGGMTGMGGGMSRMMMAQGMSGYGGMTGGMPGMMSGMGAAPERKGVDKRGENTAKKRTELAEAVKKSGSGVTNPYYNVVEVKVYGQARFFNPPPVETPTEPSQAAAPAPEEKKADDAAKAEPEKKAEATPVVKKEEETEAAKADATKKAEDAPKAATTKKAEDAPKVDTKDAPKAEPAKADAERKTDEGSPKS